MRFLNVPRYYFNLFNDVTIIDDEGVVLPSLDAARQQVFQSAAALIGKQISNQGRINPSHRIEVQDEGRQKVFTLKFADLIGK